MKNCTYIIALMLMFTSVNLYAQASKGFSYQAVIRNSTGQVAENQAVNLRFTIRNSTPTGAVKYRETKADTTNQFGLFWHVVGTGTVDQGNFSSILWNTDTTFMQVEVSIENAPYIDMGTTQLMSVPYAFHAQSASNTDDNQWVPINSDIYNKNGGAVLIQPDTSYNLAMGVLTNDATVVFSNYHVNIDSTILVSILSARRNNIGVQQRFATSPSGNFFDIGTNKDQGFTVEYNDVPMMTIDTNNNIGIGTDAPTAKLQVVGSATISGGGIVMCNSLNASQGNVGIGNFYGSNAKLAVFSDLDYAVYISNTSAAVAALYVNGVASKPGGSAWTVASDRRLKQNINNYNDGLAQVMKINPVTFNYNAQSGFNTEKEYVGIIAQDMQKIAPYMIGTTKIMGSETEYLSYDNNALVYMLVNGMKEQQKQIANLQQQLDELKSKK